MRYVGIQSQIRRNNRLSALLLVLFPVIILITVWVFMAIVTYFSQGTVDSLGDYQPPTLSLINENYINAVPWVTGGVGIWFLISYFFNSKMVSKATGAQPLTRKENPRIYNIVENLCMACGMDMPKINIVQDDMLNAFASGINKDSYTVTLTTGIINKLNDEELAGVVGHELTHIRNRDTRLLITSIIFVGIVYTVMCMVVKLLQGTIRTSGFRSRENKDSGLTIVVVMFIALICSAVAYLFTLMTRFAISRKREFMADAGGAELCGNPRALASALRKISQEPGLTDVNRDDVAQLFIFYPQNLEGGLSGMLNNMFSTHPDIRKRIEILEQF